MKDLTEPDLIEMGQRSLLLVKLATSYADHQERKAMDQEDRESARDRIKDLSIRVSNDMDTLCDHLRAKASQ